MLHEFERKTKVSCYMGSEEKQKCHVTWVRKENKSVMLHEFGRKTKVSCYMSLAAKELKVSCYMSLEGKQKCFVS